MRCLPRTVCSLLTLTACYNQPGPIEVETESSDDATMTNPSSDTSASSTMTNPSTTEPSTTEPSTTEPSTTEPGTDSMTMTTTDPDTTTGAELGPQIVMSVPTDGDMVAPLDSYFLLHFDRIVSPNDALGHLFVAQDGGEPQAVSPQPCPPDADPMCIAAIFPKEFVDPDSGNLPPNTEHVITLEAAFPDIDGVVNSTDQTVTFTTFDYNPDFFDDSVQIPEEFGGLVWSLDQNALFLTGQNGGGCIVRRVPLNGQGVPQAASTAAVPTGSQLCYGIDIVGPSLYVSGSYSQVVYRYTLGGGDLSGTQFLIENPTLAPPLDELDETQSVTGVDGSLFFAHGEFLGGVTDSSILRSAPAWSEFTDGQNLWNQADSGVTIAATTIDGVPILFAFAESQLFRFRIADGVVEADLEFPDIGFSTDIAIDSNNRVYLGANNGIYVVDGEADDFAPITERLGFDATRIALREVGDTVHVYYQRFRENGQIGHVPITY